MTRHFTLAAILLAAASAPAAAQSTKLPETLTWTAYDVGSGGYNQAVAIGNALKNKLGVNLRVLPGKNDVSRNIPLRDGKVPFSANGVGGSYLAQEGVFEFGARDWGPQAVRSLVLNNSDALLTIVTAKDAGIKTAADLKGKRVAWVVGAPSSAASAPPWTASSTIRSTPPSRRRFPGKPTRSPRRRAVSSIRPSRTTTSRVGRASVRSRRSSCRPSAPKAPICRRRKRRKPPLIPIRC
jgi:hypothetical protein